MTIAAPEAPAADPKATPPAGNPPAATPPAADPKATPPATPPATDPAKPKETILGGASPEAGKQGAPEKYADFKLPDGIEIKPEVLDTFRTTAKDLGLSQEGAQKLVDLQAQSVKEEIDGRMTEFNQQIEGWREESKKALGADWQRQFTIASKAVERFGTPELRSLLNETGLGNHPEIVKMLAKIGGKISEDQPVEGRRAGGEEKSTASLMFPTMEKK